MPDIRYVSLSDTHFGAENSLLTNLKTASDEVDPSKPSPVLEKLVECLAYLISLNEDQGSKPTLVLNGDIFELALADTHIAAMAFERFIDLAMAPGRELFEKIIYNPGNHDHHLWEMARETQYVEYITTNFPWGAGLPAPWHTTNIFTNPVRSYFLTRLIRRLPHLREKTIEVVYPNFGLQSQDRRKCIIFHHGHYVESIYILTSILKTLLFPDSEIPADIWDVEAENFAWIDFFWSMLGRSGDVGRVVSCIYEKLQDPKQVKKLLSNLANGLAQRYDLPGWGDVMEAKLLEWAFHAVADVVRGLERHRVERELSEDMEKGLWWYVQGPLKRQIQVECQGNMPPKVTFVFGHTHKPFQRDLNFWGYEDWVDVYNTGGWVVDTVAPQPLHGGAVTLTDENLETTSLRLYNEAERPDNYTVSVEQAGHPGDSPGPFHLRVSRLVRAKFELFQAFSGAAARAVHVRAENLRARVYASV